MINFFKKAYEIYHIICILGFSLFLNFLVGLILIIPILWILDNVECPF